MKKTKLMATISQLNRQTGNYVHTERRVYTDENEKRYVKINGEFTSLTFLFTHGRKVVCWEG